MPLESSFSQVPDTYRIPGVVFEISARNPAPTGSVSRICLIGSYSNLSSTLTSPDPVKGNATDKQPVLVTSKAQADELFGRGSVLSLEYQVAKRNAPFAEVWVYPVEIGNNARSATQDVTLSGTGSFVGTVIVSINGNNYSVSVNGTDAAGVATDIAAAFPAASDLPVTVSASGATITFTSKTAGVVGHQFTTVVNTNAIAGLTVASSSETSYTGGSDNFSAVSNWDDGLNEFSADTIVLPSYFDDVSSTATAGRNALATRIDDRWNATGTEGGVFGHLWMTVKDSASDAVTLLTPKNDEHETVVVAEEHCPTPEFIISAAYAATAHNSLISHPARPFTGLGIKGVNPPPLNTNRFTASGRNSILVAGGSTIAYVNEEATIERTLTTNQSSGTTWRQVQTPYTIMVVLRRYRQFINTNYVRSLLVDEVPKATANGAFSIQAGLNVVTPKIIKGDFIGLYRQLALEILVEDVDGFVANLIVERDANDTNRVNTNLPLNLANGLVQMAILVNFQA